jgi:glutamate synthase (NADPH/NADH) large chain
MTGGLAFVYDEKHTFIEKNNQELIEAIRIDTDDTERERIYLKKLLRDNVNETQRAKSLSML